MRKFDGYEPKHKAVIERPDDCEVCLIVDGIIVPHCDCTAHCRRKEDDDN